MAELPVFFLLLAVAYIVPGPDFALVVNAAAHGRRQGRAAAAGVVTGLTTHAVLASAGVSSLVAATRWGLPALRIVGGAYLVWLGGSLLRASVLRAGSSATDRAEGGHHVPAHPTLTVPDAWRRGLLGNLLNPKTLLFFLALIPQFVDRGHPFLPQVAALSAITVAAGVAWWSLVIVVADRLGPFLARPVVRRRMDLATGIALLGLAGLVAVL